MLPFEVDAIVDGVLKVCDLNLFSATCRNLERVSLEFHCPRRLDKFRVVVTGEFVEALSSLVFFGALDA